MDLKFFQNITHAFGLESKRYACEVYGSGLINSTYLLTDLRGIEHYVLQKINNAVFVDPAAIAYNLELAGTYLKFHNPEYLFLNSLKTKAGEPIYYDEKKNPWRIFPYIKHSKTYDQVTNEKQAFNAAQQFGRLTRLLNKISVYDFKETIKDFHNLKLRYEKFEQALKNSLPQRLQLADEAIRFYQERKYLADTLEFVNKNPFVKTRITHNDTKINNVLFDDRTDDAICVIDLDTLMPGKFMFDLGDMVRTFTSPAAEDDPIQTHVYVRNEIMEALYAGYLSEMKNILTKDEKELLFYSGQLMIYMIGIRFLTDYLENDIYYKTTREHHNLDRANNQRYLLTDLESKSESLKHLIGKYL